MTEASTPQRHATSSRILYNEDHRIAIYAACQQSVVPGDGVGRHLKTIIEIGRLRFGKKPSHTVPGFP